MGGATARYSESARSWADAMVRVMPEEVAEGVALRARLLAAWERDGGEQQDGGLLGVDVHLPRLARHLRVSAGRSAVHKRERASGRCVPGVGQAKAEGPRTGCAPLSLARRRRRPPQQCICRHDTER